MPNPERPNRLHAPLTWLVTLLLACAAAPMARAADDEPADFDTLKKQVSEFYRNADYEKALECAEKMHELQPGHANTMYDIACLQCLLGHKDKAYTWLEKSIAAGFENADHLASDDDFKTIHAQARFRAILRQLRSDKERAADTEKPAKLDKPKKPDKPDKPAKPDKPEKPAKTDKPKESDKPKKAAKPDKPKKTEVPKLSIQEHGQRVTALTGQLVEAAQGGNPAKALELGLEALAHAKALRVQIGAGAAQAVWLTNYNVACMYSLLDNKDQAFAYLDEAVACRGYRGNDQLAQIENDTDFNNIRKDPRYAKVIAEVKKRRSGDPAAEGDLVEFAWKATLPKSYDKSSKAPLIIALHPYNADMATAVERWKKAANKVGAILLTPQGTYRLGDGRFHWGRGLDTIEENVMDAINEVLDEYNIDEDKLILTGFSQSGWVTWSLAMRNPDVFCGIIPVAGRFEAMSKSDLEDEDLAKLRIYIMVGEEENAELLESNRRAAKQLGKTGAKVKLNVYEDLGHEYPKKPYKKQIAALEFILQD